MAIKNTLHGLVSPKRSGGGFALLIAVIFMSVMLTFGLSLSSLGYKQQVLASSSLASQYAFYAADSGLECAQHADQQQKIFEYSEHDESNHPDPISCDGDTASEIAYTYDATKMVVKQRIWLDANTHCADVTIYKYSAPQPPSNVDTYVFSQGYDISCDVVANPNGGRFASRGIHMHY